MSLNKILILPECDEKHMRLQALANIINTMIESCPAPNTSAPQQGQHRLPQLIINNMIKIMYKRGLINDLAKMIHSIELSSSKLADTVNAVLKPMETLSRAINYATSLHVPAASRPHTNRHPTSNQTNSSTVPSSTATTTTATTTTTDSIASTDEQTTIINEEQSTRLTTDSSRSTEQQQQQHISQDSTLVSTNEENRSSLDNTNTNNNNTSLNSANQVLLSISQEELLNATDMEPVAGLPQEVDIFERSIHGTARLSTDDEDDDDDDDGEASIEDEDEDDDGAVGTINVEFDVTNPHDDTPEHGMLIKRERKDISFEFIFYQ
jgi:E3 ubiquitin-protein ligase HUWE1